MNKLPTGTVSIIIEKLPLSGWQIKVSSFGAHRIIKAKILGNIETWQEIISIVEKYCDDIEKAIALLIENSLIEDE